MNLFLPDSGLVVWMLIAFSIVFFVLAKYAWPTILNSIKQREDYIASSIAKANEALETLSELDKKGEKIIAVAKEEQMRLITETKQINEQMIAKAKEDAKLQAQKILDSAHEQIQKEREKAIEDLRKEVTSLSILMAEKVIKKELDDKKSQINYIERLLKENANNELS